MRNLDDSSEVEPLVPAEYIRESRHGTSFLTDPQRVTKDLKSLEIVAVFVVAFDTQHGNVLEWAKPEFMREQLGGVEFKAMPSGAHTMEEDTVYLYESELYGVACYGKISVANEHERGARMRSVGILTQSKDLLHIHIEELKGAVRHILAHPGDYSLLERYHQRWSGDFFTHNSSFLSTLDLTYPADHFEQLITTLGHSLFTVWKAVLLQKRIMFYGQPPASHLCHLIHCANAFMNKSDRLRKDLCTPFYFVNIADCDILSRQISYIACTTEKVFETKTDIYDMYVDCGTMTITNSRMRPILCPTRGDRIRLQQLHSVIRQPTSCDELPMTVEDTFYSYFGSLNTAVGEKLHCLATSDAYRISHTDISAMGLHPSDSAFINELLESFNLDISVGCVSCDCLPI